MADEGDGEVLGLAGFLRRPRASAAGMFCPIVKRSARGRGLGGKLLRAARDLGAAKLGIEFATAGIGTRNRAGYSLLTSHGFRPVRQHFLMRCDAEPLAVELSAPEFELGPARTADADAILEIYRDCGFEEREPAAMLAALDDGRHRHAVARRGGSVVAFAELETHWPQRVWVAYVGVIRELRDRGVGSSLVSWALARHFEAGGRAALLLLSPANRSALRAYEKVGFRRYRLIDVLESGI